MRNNDLWGRIEKGIEQGQKANPFTGIDSYNGEMTISQVIKYFERQGMNTFTKTMIQNYVRINLIPPPKEKRYYTREHLKLLVMIEFLKNIYSLEEIKSIFVKMENLDVFDDFLSMYNQAILDWSDSLNPIRGALEEKPVHTQELYFMLMLMANSLAAKQIYLGLTQD